MHHMRQHMLSIIAMAWSKEVQVFQGAEVTEGAGAAYPVLGARLPQRAAATARDRRGGPGSGSQTERSRRELLRCAVYSATLHAPYPVVSAVLRPDEIRHTRILVIECDVWHVRITIPASAPCKAGEQPPYSVQSGRVLLSSERQWCSHAGAEKQAFRQQALKLAGLDRIDDAIKLYGGEYYLDRFLCITARGYRLLPAYWLVKLLTPGVKPCQTSSTHNNSLVSCRPKCFGCLR